jgi:hypothetical protein
MCSIKIDSKSLAAFRIWLLVADDRARPVCWAALAGAVER